MRVLNRQQMRDADARTIEALGVPASTLMERAGRRVAEVVLGEIGDTGGAAGRPVTILCGRGNNGGDGCVVALALVEAGARPTVFIAGDAGAMQGLPRTMLDRFIAAGGQARSVPDESAWATLRGEALAAPLIVDALTGTGLESPATGLVARIIEDVNASARRVVAVDLPSGLSADSHRPIGPAIRAGVTVTFAAPKIPLVLPPADALAGRLVVADIGIPEEVIDALAGPRLEWVRACDVARHFAPRDANTNKGDYGRIAIVAGAVGTAGAAALAGLAALRAGAGLVTVATPASAQPQVASFAPEYMTQPLPETGGELDSAAALQRVVAVSADVVAAGPGLGRGPDVESLVAALIDWIQDPLVLDADALNVLEGDAGRLDRRRGRVTILTPHPGEMARLTGRSVFDIQSDRIEAARTFAAAHGVHVVLKGHRTIVAAPDGRLAVNSTGNPGMATAGAGDVLTGVVTALAARIDDAHEAAVAAVYFHGLAADLAAERVGEDALIARDIIEHLAPAAMELSRHAKGARPA
jgi:NAD(P)H-hydrate epimerase